jgi:protein phosphatase 1 regulatory subunit 42
MESRFTNFFSYIKRSNKIKNYKYNSISFEKIENGEDKRTTVLIKNIPNSITKELFYGILDGVGNINYLYLPFNKQTNKNLGIAFVNMINYKNIINLYKRLTNYKFKEIEKPIEICYYKIQGRINLSKMFSKHLNNVSIN